MLTPAQSELMRQAAITVEKLSRRVAELEQALSIEKSRTAKAAEPNLTDAIQGALRKAVAPAPVQKSGDKGLPVVHKGRPLGPITGFAAPREKVEKAAPDFFERRDTPGTLSEKIDAVVKKARG